MDNIEVRILEEAYDGIKRGHYRFICIALGNSSYISYHRDKVFKLRDRVMELLNGNGCLESWLRDKGFNVDLNELDHLRKLRTTRLAWIKHLIKEYQ